MPEADETETLETDQVEQADTEDQDDTTYPAKVVKDLRKESASYRERAKTAESRVDELSRALFTAKVEATGKLHSVDDLKFDAALLDDADALDDAIEALIASHPHYAKRKISGNIGQNERGTAKTAPQDFSSLLR